MQKILLIILVLATFLGKAPVDTWDSFTEAKKQLVVKVMAVSWCKINDCKTAVVIVEEEDDDFVYFYINCTERFL